MAQNKIDYQVTYPDCVKCGKIIMHKDESIV
jgi:hypothetical protein